MSSPEKLRLGVNIDHVATVRNARGGDTPDPLPQKPFLPSEKIAPPAPPLPPLQ